MKNKKTLIIVESPNKVKKIASFLGPDFSVRSTVGHIMDLVKTKTNPLGVNIEKDYEPKYAILPDKKDKVSAIIDAINDCDNIICCADGDLEGECISFHVKDCLESSGLPIKRAIFNEITKSAVLKAVQNTTELNEAKYHAQQGRRVLDRLVGFMVSPYLIKTLGPGLSAGRVQSVSCRIIIDREREIESFKPEEYWNIFSTLAKPTDLFDKFTAKYTKKIINQTDADKIKKDLDKDIYTVSNVDAKEKKRNPLPPLTTPKLQQAAAGRFGFSVSKTMKIAQSLYESGLVTYIRTDSTNISAEAITMARNWLTSNNYNIPIKPNFYASSANSQAAHECIRPSDLDKTPDKVFLTDDNKKLYKLIWERFIACQMEPAIYDTMAITINTSSGHELKASGRALKYKGFLAIATDLMSYKKEGDEDDIQLPHLSINDKLVLVDPKVQAEQKFTQPPPRYSEAGLVKELEKRGIGRPSTYADIIEKIKGRGYVELKGKIYHGTELGKKVVDILVKNFKFMEIDYTANMEKQLDDIAEGKLTYVEMLDSFFKPFQIELKAAYDQGIMEYEEICKCGGKMFVRHGMYGLYVRCINYKISCNNTFSCDVVDGKVIKKEFVREAVEGVYCPKCENGMVEKNGKWGRYYSCVDYPHCVGSRKIPFGVKCEKCGVNEMYQTSFSGIPKLACMGYPSCKNIIDIPKGKNVDWINPDDLQSKKPKKYIKKVLSAKRK